MRRELVYHIYFQRGNVGQRLWEERELQLFNLLKRQHNKVQSIRDTLIICNRKWHDCCIITYLLSLDIVLKTQFILISQNRPENVIRFTFIEREGQSYSYFFQNCFMHDSDCHCHQYLLSFSTLKEVDNVTLVERGV